MKITQSQKDAMISVYRKYGEDAYCCDLIGKMLGAAGIEVGKDKRYCVRVKTLLVEEMSAEEMNTAYGWIRDSFKDIELAENYAQQLRKEKTGWQVGDTAWYIGSDDIVASFVVQVIDPIQREISSIDGRFSHLISKAFHTRDEAELELKKKKIGWQVGDVGCWIFCS